LELKLEDAKKNIFEWQNKYNGLLNENLEIKNKVKNKVSN
jgi:hypothetical protein